MLVIGVAAGAVVLRMNDPMRRARMGDAIGQVTHYDALARVYARAHDRPLRLVVDLAAGRVERTDRRGERDDSQTLAMPDGYRIARLIVGERDVNYGSVSIACNRHGMTPSYAMLLTGPAESRRWVLTAGLTGAHVELESDEEVRNILAAIGGGSDAR